MPKNNSRDRRWNMRSQQVTNDNIFGNLKI